MRGSSSYTPEVARANTIERTAKINTENVFAILNRLQGQIDSLRSSDDALLIDGSNEMLADINLNGFNINLDVDRDTYLGTDGDDHVELVMNGAAGQFDITIDGVDDFTFTANSFNVLSGSHILMADDTWIGLGAATGRLYFDSSPSPNEMRLVLMDLDLNNNDIVFDTDGDTYIHSTADDVVTLMLATAAGEFEININGNEDFNFQADTFNVLAGSHVEMADDTWIGFTAGGQLVWDSTPAVDEIRVVTANLDLNNNDLILDSDGDTYLHASADNVIDLILAGAAGEFAININGVEDFTFTANSLNVLAGSAILLSTSTSLINFGDADSYLYERADDIVNLTLAGASGEFEITINGSEDFNFQADTLNVLAGSHVEMGDDCYIGFTGGGRIVFDSTPATDLLTFSDCTVTFGSYGLGIIHSSAGGALTSSAIVNGDLGNLGTQNYLAKFGATGLVDSLIRDDGATVGVGMAPGTPRLSVNGKLEAGQFLAGITPGAMRFTNDVNEQSLVIYGENNIGNACAYIGTTHYGLSIFSSSVSSGVAILNVGNALDPKYGTGTTPILSVFANQRIAMAGVTVPLGNVHIGGSEPQLYLGIPGVVNATIATSDSMFFCIDADNTGTGAFFSFRKNAATYLTSSELMRINESGDINIPTDAVVTSYGVHGEVTLTHVHNVGLRYDDAISQLFGTANDAGIQYNGTDLLINSSLVAASDINVTCGANKTIELQNTVFEDLQFSITTGKVSPAGSAPNWETFTTNTDAYAFGVNEELDTQCNELPHCWKEATTGHLHLHFAIKTAQSTGADRFAKFTIWLAMADVNEVYAETPYTQEYTIPTGTAALTHLYLDMGNVDLSTYKVGGQIEARVKRIAATGGTEYADDVYITQVGMHLENDTLGSRQETVK